MKIIVFRDSAENPLRLNVNQRSIAIVAGSIVFAFVLFAASGFWLASSLYSGSAHVEPELTRMQHTVSSQEQELASLKQENKRHLDALALKMGDLQARATRLEALGGRLTVLGNLDDGEFNFDQDPPIGGPSESINLESMARVDLEDELLNLESRIQDQQSQLSLLESLIAHRELDSRMAPSGRPVVSGWLSSHYGQRADPFTGEASMHYGIDFAGKMNSSIISVGDGVVTWSGKRVGYGYTVDIDHGNGYVTRYAHNSKNLVKVGDRVTAGQHIALMGTTGRSTSPHVHFEVWFNNHRINPTDIVKKLAS